MCVSRLLLRIAGGSNPFHITNPAVVTASQQTNVFKYTSQSGNVTYIWQGDRWQSAPSPNRYKGEDFTYWYPLTFNADGTIQHLQWVDNFELDA